LLWSSQAVAGAWTQPAGSFYIKASFSVAEASEQIKGALSEAQPLLDPNDLGVVWEGALFLYGEWGLPIDIPGGLTVIGAIPYKFSEIDTQVALRRTEGIGDLILGVRWGIPLDSLAPLVLSIQADTKIPTGYTANLPEGDRIPWLGNGVPEETVSLLVGYSFWPLPVYTTGGFGYRLRGSDEAGETGAFVDYEDELPYSLEIGLTIADLVLVRTSVDGIIPTADVAVIDVAGGALTPPSSSHIRAGGGLIFTLPEGIQVNFDYSQVLDGSNTALSESMGFGIAWAQ
jgi:hypothetical protein